MPSKKKQYKFTYKGRRLSVRADSDREAGALIEQKKAKLDESSPSSSMTVKAWYEMTIDSHTLNQNEHSAEVTRSMIKNHVLKEIGGMALSSVKANDLQIILNHAKGKSKTTIDYIWGGIQYLFRTAQQNHMIIDNPAKHLVKPKGEKGKRRALTDKERTAVLRVAKTKRLYYGYLLMILCGCRPSEAWACKGEDIVRDKGYNLLHIKGTKTQASDRYVPIPDELYNIIKDTPKDEYIALSEDGTQVKGNYSRRWRQFRYHLDKYMGAPMYRNKVLENVFDPKISPYYLRHEYCTNLARKGIDVRIAQKLMGHSSIQMTADIYTNLDRDDIVSAAKVLV